MKYSAILFDFDGTLAENSFLFLDVLNELSQEFGFEPIGVEEIPRLRRMGAKEILTQRLRIPLWNILKIRRLDRAQKRVWREKVSETEIRLFSGMPQLIKDIRDRGIVVGIVSSNLLEVIERAIQSAHVEVDFVHAGSRVFGKAGAIRKVIKQYQIDSHSVLYVGDEIRDLEACRTVGIPMIGVGWGLNAPEALQARGVVVVSTLEELRAKILS